MDRARIDITPTGLDSLERLVTLIRADSFLTQASTAADIGPAPGDPEPSPAARRKRRPPRRSPASQPAPSSASLSPTAPVVPTRDEVAIDAWARHMDATPGMTSNPFAACPQPFWFCYPR